MVGSGGLAAPVGGLILAHGLDHFFTGMQTAFSGNLRESVTTQLLQKTGMSQQISNLVDGGLSIAGSMGGLGAIRSSQLVSFPKFLLPIRSINNFNPIRPYRELQNLTKGLKGEYQAHHILEQRHMKNWGYGLNERLDVPSQILTRQEHQKVTNLLRSELSYSKIYSEEAVWKCYQKIYSDKPEYLNAIEHYFFD